MCAGEGSAVGLAPHDGALLTRMQTKPTSPRERDEVKSTAVV